ncbi:hypothetical protein TPHA_0B00150 [Tetrapisispora phaffii CBS 4417]|uniref:Uncharacterized protein n=1 Tax=Tetrapisispora phaffii (strain ATCC 24235 / CBS 4417 / NBRC 1672 / NRRL Y-8282 / UCD 70-5) TaxID=1071381 RepID=G8BQ90_TETPH|nr:hypothetical protein TPHA_0B00150 [Tetrapisispora phaffii CBS 4417]CCE61687.1 hypothetical protein TPHA_0B00150 [Tetrapisispora phaffii CBS 4417]
MNKLLFTHLIDKLKYSNDPFYLKLERAKCTKKFAKLIIILLTFTYETTEHIKIIKKISSNLKNVNTGRWLLFLRAAYMFVNLDTNVGNLNLAEQKNKFIWIRLKKIIFESVQGEDIGTELLETLNDRLQIHEDLVRQLNEDVDYLRKELRVNPQYFASFFMIHYPSIIGMVISAIIVIIDFINNKYEDHKSILYDIKFWISLSSGIFAYILSLSIWYINDIVYILSCRWMKRNDWYIRVEEHKVCNEDII